VWARAASIQEGQVPPEKLGSPKGVHPTVDYIHSGHLENSVDSPGAETVDDLMESLGAGEVRAVADLATYSAEYGETDREESERGMENDQEWAVGAQDAEAEGEAEGEEEAEVEEEGKKRQRQRQRQR